MENISIKVAEPVAEVDIDVKEEPVETDGENQENCVEAEDVGEDDGIDPNEEKFDMKLLDQEPLLWGDEHLLPPLKPDISDTFVPEPLWD